MAKNGAEGTAAMGIDAPLAVLSDMHQNLFGYFKQRFAQVTNPPIDAIREKVVTSTTVYIGEDGNLLEEKAENCKMLKVNNPILTETDLLKIKNMKEDGFKVAEIPTIYYKNSSLEKAIDYLFIEVDRAIREGANILILSDRGVDEYHVAMPSLLVLSGLQQHLVRTKKRTSVGIVLETGEPREVHHFATLIGYGACAINPYLAHESIKQLIDTDMLQKDYYAAVDDYNNAVLSGIVKIASKMGISTIQSYQGAKIFEAIGLKQEFIDKYFTDTVSRIGGIGIEEIAADYIGTEMNGEGEIAILTWPAASATADRAKGFKDKMEEKYPNIKIVSEQDCNADRSSSLAATESIIQANGDIKFVWGANAEMALGAYAATQSLNRSDINVVAVDTDGEVMEAIQNGTNLVATVSQDPYTMGYKALENAVKYLDGEKVEDIAIECELVTADNCAEIIERNEEYLNK